MVEATTLAGMGMVVLGSKDLLHKLLGPTADYLGEKTVGLVKKCDINIDSIFQKALEKLGPRINDHESVSPRVLKTIITEGAFVEDELTQEYYAGVLAASRSDDSDDDRLIVWAKLIENLSAFDLRLHYVCYMSLRSKHLGTSNKNLAYIRVP